MSHKIFTCTHRVSYAECTVGNHVYYSRFLDILERARGEFFRALGSSLLQLQSQETIFPVTECKMTFRAMAHYDDVLTIEMWLTELGRARLHCANRTQDASGKVVFEAVTALGCTNLEGKPRRIPAQLIDSLKEYLAPVGDGEHPSRAMSPSWLSA